MLLVLHHTQKMLSPMSAKCSLPLRASCGFMHLKCASRCTHKPRHCAAHRHRTTVRLLQLVFNDHYYVISKTQNNCVPAHIVRNLQRWHCRLQRFRDHIVENVCVYAYMCQSWCCITVTSRLICNVYFFKCRAVGWPRRIACDIIYTQTKYFSPISVHRDVVLL